MKTEYVRDWMKADPVTVGPDTSLSRAYDLMQRHQIRRLPVTEGEWLVGMVTLKDVWAAMAGFDSECDISKMASHLNCLTVMRVMRHEVVTVTPDTPIEDACELMLRHKIGGLPVLVEGRLVGILVESDIFRLVTEHGFVNDNGS